MANNAKLYNEESSSVASDADQILRILSQKKSELYPPSGDHEDDSNPQLPKERGQQNGELADQEGSKATEDDNKPATQNSLDDSAQDLDRAKSGEPAARPSPEVDDQSKTGFEGLTLQEAQEKIVFELMNLKNER